VRAEQRRLLVIGDDVNGSICATRLCQAGCDVTVLARGRRYEAIRDDRIIIEDPMTKQRSVTRVHSLMRSIHMIATTPSWSWCAPIRSLPCCWFWRAMRR
jgi:choline dehydrogenase-like flavoprotein